MKRHGFSAGFPFESSLSVVFTYEDVTRLLAEKQSLSQSEWIQPYFGKNISLDQLKRDWGECLRGKKRVKTLTAQYCCDCLLEDDVKTSENARALSKALMEELPMERQRYLGRSSEEYTEIVATVKVQEWVSQEIAAAFLAPYLRGGTCSKRNIRKLAGQEKIHRNRLTGKIKSSSLIDYCNKLKII